MALLERLTTQDKKGDAAKLTKAVIINLQPYINARWSCHHDQANLLRLIRSSLWLIPEDTRGLLAEVVRTIGNPELIREASEIISRCTESSEEDEKFRAAPRLQPLEDDECPDCSPDRDSIAQSKASTLAAGGRMPEPSPAGQVETGGPGGSVTGKRADADVTGVGGDAHALARGTEGGGAGERALALLFAAGLGKAEGEPEAGRARGGTNFASSAER
ncbi:hypothetical protein HWV62_32485 [Athelia sp. TMB]|nr:hypothetical protein HWV62_32485 [Athelia sp. TMB]